MSGLVQQRGSEEEATGPSVPVRKHGRVAGGMAMWPGAWLQTRNRRLSGHRAHLGTQMGV